LIINQHFSTCNSIVAGNYRSGVEHKISKMDIPDPAGALRRYQLLSPLATASTIMLALMVTTTAVGGILVAFTTHVANRAPTYKTSAEENPAFAQFDDIFSASLASVHEKGPGIATGGLVRPTHREKATTARSRPLTD
jgi:hypothetical protein